MSNQFGIHLANGAQDIARVISLGCHHHLALEMQADYLSHCPGERYLRLWHQPQDDPRQVIERARQYVGITRHIIPWNEANIETNLSYKTIAESFLRLAAMVDPATILHWPALAPCEQYRECRNEWLPAASVADVVDIHAYGSAAQILEIVDWYHSVLPDKELLLTECNPGAGNRFDQGWWAAEYLALVAALLDRPWVIAAIGFIWQWHNPDVPLPQTVDWLGQPIEAAVRAASKTERPNHSNNSNSSTGGETVATFRVGNLDVIDLRTSLPQHATARYEARALGAIEKIVIHHSATDDDRSAERIAEYHVNNNGWPGIAYQFLVHQDGRIEYCQGVEVVSYGVARRNDNTMHICLVGNWTSRIPGEVQLAAAKMLIDNLCYALGRVYPIVGHTEIAPSDYSTACPGATWPQWRGRLVDAETPTCPHCADLRRQLETATAANATYRAYLQNIRQLADTGLKRS